MGSYLLGRPLQSLMLLVLVSVIGFAVLHLAPGGPLAQFARVRACRRPTSPASPSRWASIGRCRCSIWDWFSRLLTGRLGPLLSRQPAGAPVIGSHLGATLELMATATLIAVLLGTWIGVMGAVRRYSLFDYLATVGAMVALSIPTFWFGLVTIYVFSVKLGWLPSGNRYTVGDGSFLDLCTT